jgi:hypothetical protein
VLVFAFFGLGEGVRLTVHTSNDRRNEFCFWARKTELALFFQSRLIRLCARTALRARSSLRNETHYHTDTHHMLYQYRFIGERQSVA